MVKFASLIFLTLYLQSCSTSPAYVPTTHTLPTYGEDDQIVVLGNSVAGRGIELQMAYKFNSPYYLGLSSQYNNVGNCISCSRDKRNFNEINFGKYLLEKKVNKEFEYTQYSSGIGYGNSEIHSTAIFGSGNLAKGDYLRSFIQYSSGNKSKYFESGYSARLSGIYFISYSEYDNDSDKDILIFRHENVIGLFLEPAYFIRFGFENVKLETQFGSSVPLFKQDFNQEAFNLSLGLKFEY